MKKNTIMRIAAVVLMCTLVTACFASSTFAKYTSAADGRDVARVAKWEIVQGEGANAVKITGANPVITVDLFSYTDATGNVDENGVNDDAKVIAPGTTGSFGIDAIFNNSEVTANIEVKIKSVTNSAGIPVVIKKGDTVLYNGSTITNAQIVKQDVAIGGNLAAQDITWEWVFEKGADDVAKAANDDADTTLGTMATLPTITVELEIVATQVD